jgi:hypothetical protein
MNAHRIIFSGLVILAVLILVVLPAHGQTEVIAVNGADATSNLSLAASSSLNTLIDTVEPRFVMQYANANRYYTLVPIPYILQTLLGQVGDRFIIQYANSNRLYTLTYPTNLIGDTTPPQMSGLAVNSMGGGIVTISWVTDEPATAALRYGTQSGTYTQMFNDDLYYKLHGFTLSGLTAGTSYYYRIGNTDRSGNSTESQELSFKVSGFIYLPLIRR